MTLPTANFADYRGRLAPTFTLNARLLKLGAQYIYGRVRNDDTEASLGRLKHGLDQVAFSQGSYVSCLQAFSYYDGARVVGNSSPKLQEKSQIFKDLMASYILEHATNDIKKQRYQLESHVIEAHEDHLKIILRDYARDPHHNEEMRGEIFAQTYGVLRAMQSKFGISLGKDKSVVTNGHNGQRIIVPSYS